MRLTESGSNHTSTCISSSRTTVRFPLWSYWGRAQERDKIERKERHSGIRWFIPTRTKGHLDL